jgi:hypothetical protein
MVVGWCTWRIPTLILQRASAPGRPMAVVADRRQRDKISAAFLEALNDTFHEPNAEGGSKGLDARKKVRDEDPATYARIFAALMSKHEQLGAYCAELERQIAERAARSTPTAAIVAITPGSQRMN